MGGPGVLQSWHKLKRRSRYTFGGLNFGILSCGKGKKRSGKRDGAFSET